MEIKRKVVISGNRTKEGNWNKYLVLVLDDLTPVENASMDMGDTVEVTIKSDELYPIKTIEIAEKDF